MSEKRRRIPSSKDLDEYDDATLRREVDRRRKAREAGLCDCCGHPLREPLPNAVYESRRFRDRHYAEALVPRPEVVVLCGSTRFFDAFQTANYELTLAGKIVLTVGCDTKSGEGLSLSAYQKRALDELHKRKIDLADTVLVLNVRGYVGPSTQSEIAYAQRIGKPVAYLETRQVTRGPLAIEEPEATP